MGKIFCLMGKSSSGKDSIFKALIADKELKLNPVISYTTRPRRIHEKNGIDYNFIDDVSLKQFKEAGKIIEIRKYNTIKGIWHYCTIDDGQIALSKGNYLLIMTIESYKSLQEYYGKDAIIPIYIEVEDEIRKERALKREKKQEAPNYEELNRRFLADNEDFSEEKLKENQINKRFRNDDFEACILKIKEDLKGEFL